MSPVLAGGFLTTRSPGKSFEVEEISDFISLQDCGSWCQRLRFQSIWPYLPLDLWRLYIQISQPPYWIWSTDVLVAQLCLILCDPMDCSWPGSSVHGILQARTLEWVAISFSRVHRWWQLIQAFLSRPRTSQPLIKVSQPHILQPTDYFLPVQPSFHVLPLLESIKSQIHLII